MLARPWVSTTAATTSLPRSRSAMGLAEHRERLADARCGAEIDAQFTAFALAPGTRTAHSVIIHQRARSA